MVLASLQKKVITANTTHLAILLKLSRTIIEKVTLNKIKLSLKKSWRDLKKAIRVSQAWFGSRDNERRRDPVFAPRVLAYMDIRHVMRGQPTSKLNHRWTGPFRVEAVHGG